MNPDNQPASSTPATTLAMGVELTDGGIRIRNALVEAPEVRDFFRELDAEERVEELARVIQIGVVALRRALASNELAFVKAEVLEILSPGSPLGKSIKSLGDMVNPKNEDSIQKVVEAALESAVEEIVGDEGLMAQVVEALLESDDFTQMIETLQKIHDRVLGKEGEKGTTKVGAPFEEEVYEKLQDAFGQSGCSVEWSGPDNKSGDVVMSFDDEPVPFKVVIEAKNHSTRSYGKTKARSDAEAAMRRRDAQAAIIVVSGVEAFSKEMGDWREGAVEPGPWIATTFDLLTLAVRIARIQLHRKFDVSAEVDIPRAAEKIGVIRAQMTELSKAKNRLTDAKSSAQGAWDVIDAMQRQVAQAVKDLENALRIGVSAAEESSTA